MTFHLSWSKSQPSHPDLQGHTTPGPCLQTPTPSFSHCDPAPGDPAPRRGRFVPVWPARLLMVSLLLSEVPVCMMNQMAALATHLPSCFFSSACLLPPWRAAAIRHQAIYTAHSPDPGTPPPLPSSPDPGTPSSPALLLGLLSSLDFSPHPLFFSFVYCVSLPAPLCRLCEGKVLLLFSFFSFYFIFWPHHVVCGILVTHSGIEPVAPCIGSSES